ncbi:MAG: hypothetical protein QW561_02805 [Candidatus Aenigmatarchaeota archaeon]
MQKVSFAISVIALALSIGILAYTKLNEPVVIDLFTLVSSNKIAVYENAIKNGNIESANQQVSLLIRDLEDILREYRRPILLKQAVLNPAYNDITDEVNRKLQIKYSRHKTVPEK